MIAHLLGGLRAAVDRGRTRRPSWTGTSRASRRSWRAISATRNGQLLTILETLDLPADPADALGPL